LRNWSFGRRALYLVASPLIAVVLCWRIMPDAWRTVRRQRLSLATMVWIVIGTILRVGGEFLAYAGASDLAYRRQMYEYEVHKEAFVRGSVSSVEAPASGSRKRSIEPGQSECASRTLQTAPSPSQPRPCGT
jgi:hypothetical protein